MRCVMMVGACEGGGMRLWYVGCYPADTAGLKYSLNSRKDNNLHKMASSSARVGVLGILKLKLMTELEVSKNIWKL